MKNLVREVNILKMIEHENILRLLFCVEDNRQVHLVTEHVASHLASYVRKGNKNRLSEGESRVLFR